MFKRFSGILVIVIIGVMCVGNAVAQQAGGKDEKKTDPAMDSRPEGRVSESKDAKDMAQEYVRERLPFHPGYNQDSGIYVAIGQGRIDVLPKKGAEAYQISRSLAYVRARLGAMGDAASYMGEAIESRLSDSMNKKKGSVKKREVGARQENDAPSLIDKGLAWAHKKTDQALKEEDIDPNNLDGKKKVPEATMQRITRKVSRSAAQQMVAGMQDQKVFEGGGKIAVVAMISPKSYKAVNGIRNSMSGGEVPKFKPQGIKLPSSKQAWLTQMGARMVVDKHGNLGILAFGQAAVDTFEDIAESEAEVNAKGALRQFVGAAVMTETKSEKLQSTVKLKGQPDKKRTNTAKKFRRQTESVAKEMKISGIYARGSEIVEHPLTGGKIAVVAVQWTPKSAQNANKMREKMKEMGNAGGGQSGGNVQENKGTDKDKKESIKGESGGGVW